MVGDVGILVFRISVQDSGHLPLQVKTPHRPVVATTPKLGGSIRVESHTVDRPEIIEAAVVGQVCVYDRN